MSTAQLERLLDRFARAAIGHHLALESLDEKRANRYAENLGRLAEGIFTYGTAGEAGLVALTHHPEPAVAGMAAVYLLPRRTDLALGVLRRVTLEPGLLGFRASVAIERWERGEWE